MIPALVQAETMLAGLLLTLSCMFKVISLHLRDAAVSCDNGSRADAGQEPADRDGQAVSGQGVQNAVSHPALRDQPGSAQDGEVPRYRRSLDREPGRYVASGH